MKISNLYSMRARLLSWPKKIFYIAFLGGFLGALIFTLIFSVLFFGGRAIWRGLDVDEQLFNGDRNRDQGDIVGIVEKANPAVVSIIIKKDVPLVERSVEEDPFFGFLFPVERRVGSETRQVGGGSGFIVNKNGLVVTNKHVVSATDVEYSIFTQDGKEYGMEIIDIDPFFDLAIVQIVGGGNFPYLQFGDSDHLKLGETAIAIGYALGEFRNSVSVGVVSGLSRSIEASTGYGRSELLEEVIQTDAAINPGNSGGPLLDSSGKVIGVNVAVASGVENIAFALPGELAEQAVLSVEKSGFISRPYLGVRFAEVTERLSVERDLPVKYGALIESLGGTSAVIKGSPADRAGILDGDIIIEVDGESLQERTLSSVIREKNIGDEITLTVVRDGKRIVLRTKLEAAPETI